MTSNETAFEIGADWEPSELLRALGPPFELRTESPTAHKRTYYDTFDGRIVRSGSAVSLSTGREGKRLLWQPEEGRSLEQAVEDEPGFARDLPAGRLRDDVGGLIEMRRLLP